MEKHPRWLKFCKLMFENLTYFLPLFPPLYDRHQQNCCFFLHFPPKNVLFYWKNMGGVNFEEQGWRACVGRSTMASPQNLRCWEFEIAPFLWIPSGQASFSLVAYRVWPLPFTPVSSAQIPSAQSPPPATKRLAHQESICDRFGSFLFFQHLGHFLTPLQAQGGHVGRVFLTLFFDGPPTYACADVHTIARPPGQNGRG